MDEQKAVEYLDGLKKRAFMTMNEVDLANLVIKYKKQINKAIEYIENEANISYEEEIKMKEILEGKEVE